MSSARKMVMVVFNEAMDDEVMDVIEGCGAKNYTKIAGTFGRGTRSGTHLGNDIWPGQNNILLVACEDAQADKLLACIATLREKLGHEGVKAFVWRLESVT